MFATIDADSVPAHGKTPKILIFSLKNAEN